MEPAQQAQPAEAFFLQKPPPPQVQHLQPQPVGLCRWTLAALSVLAVAALSVFMVLIGPESTFGQLPLDDPGVEPEPREVIMRQFQTYHAEPQRFVLYTSLGQVLLSEGRYAKAETHFNSALSLAQSGPEQAEALRSMGLVRLHQGRAKDAQGHLEKALVVVAGGSEVAVLRTLADARAEMGHVEAALEQYSEAFALADGLGDADEMALLAANMGGAWVQRGNLKEALAWLRRATEALDAGRRSGAGVDERVAAKASGFLATAHHQLGDIPRAMALYRKAVEAQQRLLRPSHPELVATSLGLARALRDLADPEASLAVIEAIEMALQEGPQEGLDLSRTLIFKSDMLREVNRTELAEEVVQEAMRQQGSVLQGEDHPDVAAALSSYGSILHDLGRAREAHDKYEQALSINLRTVGEKHPGTAAAYNSLGALYGDVGDDSAAQKHFSKCLEIQLDTVGRESPDVANTYNNLATLHFRQGRHAEAVALLRWALEVLDGARVPQNSPDRLLYQENLEGVLSAASGADA